MASHGGARPMTEDRRRAITEGLARYWERWHVERWKRSQERRLILPKRTFGGERGTEAFWRAMLLFYRFARDHDSATSAELRGIMGDPTVQPSRIVRRVAPWATWSRRPDGPHGPRGGGHETVWTWRTPMERAVLEETKRARLTKLDLLSPADQSIVAGVPSVRQPAKPNAR